LSRCYHLSGDPGIELRDPCMSTFRVVASIRESS
jgi:hypothetical protein